MKKYHRVLIGLIEVSSPVSNFTQRKQIILSLAKLKKKRLSHIYIIVLFCIHFWRFLCYRKQIRTKTTTTLQCYGGGAYKYFLLWFLRVALQLENKEANCIMQNKNSTYGCALIFMRYSDKIVIKQNNNNNNCICTKYVIAEKNISRQIHALSRPHVSFFFFLFSFRRVQQYFLLRCVIYKQYYELGEESVGRLYI